MRESGEVLTKNKQNFLPSKSFFVFARTKRDGVVVCVAVAFLAPKMATLRPLSPRRGEFLASSKHSVD